MTNEQPLNILISGAGIAGTTLALCLTRLSSFNPSISTTSPKPKITLLERSSTPRTTGQAIDIRGPGVDIIRHLSLEQKIRDRHTTEEGIAWVDSEGKVVARFDATGDPESQAGTSEYEILRGELASLLYDEVDAAKEKDGANVNVVYGESIASLEEGDDGVDVRFRNGKVGDGRFDVVVAADGMSSKTRGMMFEEYGTGGEEDVIKPMGMYIAFFTVPRVEDDVDLWRWYNAPGGLGVHMRPHRSKKTMGVYLSICLPARERDPAIDEILSKGVAEQKVMMHERFKGVGWQIERLLKGMDESEDFYMQQVARVVTPKWTTGRCALLGDSAFATMGTGTSLAMTGAWMIAGELAQMRSNDAEEIKKALKRYEDGLMPYVGKCQKLPPGVPQLANPQTKLGIGVLRTFLSTAYWTGLGSMLQAYLPENKEDWRLPEYGWKTGNNGMS